MSHFGDYMDGVPVKISEKYKRPPRVELPYSINEAPIRAQNVVDNVNYSSTFEKNVLAKLKELRSIKETKKNERRHRLQLLEEEKQKKLDAIAVAEEEDRLKQLSVSEVSYPSTDEISALSPDEKNDKTCDTNEVVITEVILPSTSTATDSQVNILQPIQVKSNYEGSLLDDPDPLQTLKLSSKVNKIQYNHNVDMLTFRDFENDTSSPFDNVELKTINDMELLAQVLQSQRESATSCPQYVQDPNYTVNSCGSQVQLEMPYIPNAYVEQPIQGPNLMYSPQNYPNGYYVQDTENVNVYVPNYQYYVPPTSYPVDPNYYGGQMPIPAAEVPQVPNGSYIPQTYYPQYLQSTYEAPNTFVPKEMETKKQVPEPQNIQTTQPPITQNTVKSRSRSVPDIVKELNDELEKLKTSERSHNVSPAPKVAPQPSPSEQKKPERRRRRSEHLPNPYDKLYPKLQSICQKIHGMGFPLDRVARVCTIIGENEKRAIECLLLIGELMDLGFSEAKVSAALAKHKFDRDKALDDLVS
ncbi:uncharacterized protein LOC115445946 [Manduca sexta]|uniref:uncharacterized protein LOC115445946 n=1 Tax=Manduca sexta TaxID=7130 RepID=UPI00188E4C37|nr:uncharacterized protein LOC115445946 [Manduca sexta]